MTTRGSDLFEQICEQPEYYLTRCEIAADGDRTPTASPRRWAATCGWSSTAADMRIKTRMLLQHLHEPVAYVPVEISPEPLRIAWRGWLANFHNLPVQPLCADFTKRAATADSPACGPTDGGVFPRFHHRQF